MSGVQVKGDAGAGQTLPSDLTLPRIPVEPLEMASCDRPKGDPGTRKQPAGGTIQKKRVGRRPNGATNAILNSVALPGESAEAGRGGWMRPP
jgi:hypothetical protein